MRPESWYLRSGRNRDPALCCARAAMENRVGVHWMASDWSAPQDGSNRKDCWR